MRIGHTWIGWSIVSVGIVHMTVGLLVFGSRLSGIVNDGIWNAVDGFPGRPAVFWFMMTGLAFVLLGIAVAALQRARVPVPPSLVWLFAAMVVIAVIAMPLSGGWLLAPAAIGLVWSRIRRGKAEARTDRSGHGV